MNQYAVCRSSMVLLFLWAIPSTSAQTNTDGMTNQEHLRAMATARDAMFNTPGESEEHKMWEQRFVQHRDTLVKRGYFIQKDLPVSRLKPGEFRFQRLIEELQAGFTNTSHLLVDVDEQTNAVTVKVWDTPPAVKNWTSIILAHEAGSNFLLPKANQNELNLTPFAAKWIDESDKPSYDIRIFPDGTARIAPPRIEGWTTEIKNIRVEKKAIVFEQFHYVSAEHRAQTGQTENHPFEGLRCRIKLEPKGNELTMSLHTIHLPSPSVGTLKRKK